MTADALKAIAAIDDALPTLVTAVAQAAAADRIKQAAAGLERSRDHEAAAREQAQQEAAEHKEAYERACRTIADMHAAAVGEVRGPHRGVVEDVADVRARAERLAKAWRDAEGDATATEQRLDAHRRALAAVLAKPGDTPFEELTEYAAHTLTRNGERLLAVAQSKKRGDATLQRVRDAETLADALAAVAEHDGLTPAAALATATIAAAAEQPAAVETERERAHAIALAEANRRADHAEAALRAIRRARDWGTVWAELGRFYGFTSTQAGQEARARRTDDERAAEQRAKAADARSAGYVTLLANTAKTADRYRAAWRSARERATHRTAQRDRARRIVAAWTDHTARTVADRDQLRTALADLAHQEQQ